MQETWVRSLGWEDPLEEGMATHFSILAWRIPWTEDKGTTDPQIHSRLKEKYVVKFRNEKTPARATKEQSKMAAYRDCQQEGQRDQEADRQGKACLTHSRPGTEQAGVYSIVVFPVF